VKPSSAIPRGNALTVVLALVLVAAIGWYLVDRLWAEQRVVVAEEETVLAKENAAQIASEVRAACDRQGQTARELGDLCRQAEVIEQEPTATIPGRPPNAEEIEAAVETVLEERPGLIRDELVAAVASYLARFPPKDGEDAPPPSDAQVFAAVIDYCSGDACRGDDGADAEPLTQAEIDAAFTRFCGGGACQGDDGARGLSCVEELGLEPCRGPAGADSTVPGPAGADGRGIVSVTFVNGGDCRMVITYTDETTQEIGGMPASMCKTPDPVETPEQ
jgi:hypothetical protein